MHAFHKGHARQPLNTHIFLQKGFCHVTSAPASLLLASSILEEVLLAKLI